MKTKIGVCIALFLALLLGSLVPALSVKAGTVVYVDKLQPDWGIAGDGGGGVFSAYIGPPAYGYVSPGSTALFDSREAGIIKAGLAVDPVSGNYEDEGLFGFKPDVTIDTFASGSITYDVETQAGVNPVWMTIEIDTGVAGNRNDNVTFQFVPTSNPAGWHTVDAAAGMWQKWNNSDGDVTGNPLISIGDVATTYTGLNVVRAYLRLGMGNSYGNGGTGTIAWVDQATLAGVTYDFVVAEKWYVDDIGSDSNEGTEAYPFLTIQHAISVAAPGDTIHVMAGTYTEAGQIVISKNLSIIGADRATTIIKPGQDTSGSGDSGSWILVNDGITFNLSKVTLDGVGRSIRQGVRYNGSGTVDDVIIQNMVAPGYMGFGIAQGYDNTGARTLNVTNSTFTNFGRVGVQADNGTGTSTVTISDNTFVCRGAGDNVNYAITVEGGANATITGNDISNCYGVASSDGSESAAIEASTYFAGGTTATITGNNIHDNLNGILVGYDATDTSDVTASGNTFTNNEVQFEATNSSVLDVAATLAGNTFDKAVSVNHLGSLLPTTWSVIQDGIDAAVNGDTVNVASGTYVLTSAITLNKDITLNGVGNPLIQVSGTGERIIMNTAGATLQGFWIEKTDKPGVQNIIAINAADLTIQNNKIWGHFVIGEGDVSRAMVVYAGAFGNLLIDNNEIFDLRQPAYISGTHTGTISNNLVYRTKGWVIEGGNLTFTNNTWGTGANANVYDIVILSAVGPTYYTDVPAMSEANNNATIEDQRTSPFTLSDVYVDDSAPACPSDCGTPAHPYQTIAAGITRVTPGGTIHVAAGTYAGNLTINKSMTITGDPGDAAAGPGPDAPLIDGGSTPGSAFFIANTVSNVTIQGFEMANFTSNDNGVGNGVSAWVGSTSNITVQDNYFHNLGYNGVLVGNDKNADPNKWGDHTGWTIRANILETFEAYGFELTNTSNSRIEDNIIHSNATWNLAATCIMVDARRNASGIVISGNQLDGEMYAGYPAIYIFANSFETPNVNLDNVLIEDNVITTTSSTSSAQVRVYSYSGTGSVTNVHVHGNSLSTLRNSKDASNTTVLMAVDATDNWWGSANGPTHLSNTFNIGAQGGVVSDNVLFVPWLNAAPPAGVSFAPVTTSNPAGGKYASIQAGVTAAIDGTVSAAAGIFTEDVTINKTLTVQGAGASSTTVIGPIGGPGSTFTVTGSNVNITGFTITRMGNNLTDWNNTSLNIAGIAIQGVSYTGLNVHDNIITGMRTGIDINNSSWHTVQNNVITNNRTGMIFRNQTDHMTVIDNDITDNWTMGILFLDASSGTNVPVQTALYSTFSGNNISGNWYGQVVERQTGGSLPTPGTTNLKNFVGNWWGTTTPVVSTAASTEPAYASQIPVAFGGTAVAPGGQPDILGAASANIIYIPFCFDVACTKPVHNETLDTYYLSIQQAIEAASAGNVIYAGAHTYIENVLVNKSLTIYGAGAGTIVMPLISNPVCSGGSLCGGAASNVFLVQASNVVIHDLAIDGDNPFINSGVVRGGADLNARNGIIKNTNATYNNLEVHNVSVRNIYLRGIYSTGGSFNFHDNVVTNVQGEYASIAIFAWGGPGIIESNDVSYANDGISANHSSGIQFLNNTVTYSGSGIHTDNSGDAGGVADLIQGNTVNCTGVSGAYGIWTFVPYIAPTVNNNTITNCDIGLSAWAGRFGVGPIVTTQFTNNYVAGNMAVGGVGAFITTSAAGYGYTDVYVNFTGNTITNYETGVYLDAGQQSWETSPDYLTKIVHATFNMNRIFGNTTGADIGAGTNYDADFDRNWWGAATGPGGAGPGTGNSIYASDVYTYWCRVAGCTAFAPVTLLDPYSPPTLTTWNNTFHWTGVPAATYYVLNIYDSGGTILHSLSVTPAVAGCVDPDFDCIYHPTADAIVNLPGGSYIWRAGDYAPVGGYGLNIGSLAFTYSPTCYSLTKTSSPVAGGTILASPAPNCGSDYLAGTVVRLTASPATNYTFKNWTGNASGTVSPVNVTMDANKSVTANFTPRVVLLDPKSPPDISVWTNVFHWTGVPGATYYILNIYNSSAATIYSQSVTTAAGSCIAPDFDCVYSPTPATIINLASGSYSWRITPYIPGLGYGPGPAGMPFTIAPACYSLTLTADPALSGTFNVTAPNCGSNYLPGTVVQVTANPAAGYFFSKWSGNATGTANPINITMNGNKGVTAKFLPSVVLLDPVSPPDITTWTNTFHWTGAIGATYYILNVYDASNVLIYSQSVTTTAGGCVAPDYDCVYSPGPASMINLADGTYHWRITPYVPGIGYVSVPGSLYFTIDRP